MGGHVRRRRGLLPPAPGCGKQRQYQLGRPYPLDCPVSGLTGRSGHGPVVVGSFARRGKGRAVGGRSESRQ